MPTKFYYVNIDTAESTQVRNLPRGIINSYIVKAADENQARQIVLRTMTPNIAVQLQNSLYVYDLDSIMYAIEESEITGRSLPMFSFMPLNGSRPRRQLNLPVRPTHQQPAFEGTAQIYTASVVPTETPPQPHQVPIMEGVTDPTQSLPAPLPAATNRVVVPPPQAVNARQIRSSMFQRNDAPPAKVTSDTLTPQQQKLIGAIGAFPASDGADEGFNARVNASVGRNMNQTRQVRTSGPKNSLTPEQYALLQNIDALSTTPVEVETDSNSQELAMEMAKAQELAAIPNDSPIGSVDLVRLQEEYAQAEAEAGVKIGGSVPANPEQVRVSMELKSSINEVLSSKTIK